MFPKVSIGGAVAVAAIGVTAAAATATAAKQGGTLRVDLSTDVDFTDPALSYTGKGWEIEYATCVKLMNYPDSSGPQGSRLTPEAATAFRISNGGKTYDFTVDVPFTRFAPGGARVTAANFKAAFDRDADPRLHSPATAFMDDVVGAGATPVSGVEVKGKHLVVNLKRAAPDFLARIAMPFFCAIPVNLARDPNGVETLAGAGPYYIAERTVNKSMLVKRNPYYKGKRPHNLARVAYTVGNSPEAIRLRVERGEADYAATVSPPPRTRRLRRSTA